MDLKIINTGVAPNTKTGDPIRVAFDKINNNFLHFIQNYATTEELHELSGEAFRGGATPATTPTGEGNRWYLATGLGVYGNFRDKNNDPIELTEGQNMAILSYSKERGFWSKQIIAINVKGGGHNYFDFGKLYNIYISEGTRISGNVLETQSFVMSVNPGEVFTINRPDRRNNRFRVAFTKVSPLTNSLPIDCFGFLENQTGLELGPVAAPEGCNHMVVQFSANEYVRLRGINIQKSNIFWDYASNPNAKASTTQLDSALLTTDSKKEILTLNEAADSQYSPQFNQYYFFEKYQKLYNTNISKISFISKNDQEESALVSILKLRNINSLSYDKIESEIVARILVPGNSFDDVISSEVDINVRYNETIAIYDGRDWVIPEENETKNTPVIGYFSQRINPVMGGGYRFSKNSNELGYVDVDLCIGLEYEKLQDSERLNAIESNISRFKNKKISFFGDSITTYENYIPSGYRTYYPNAFIDSIRDTWWQIFLNRSGGILLDNNSYSGSRVAYGGDHIGNPETKSLQDRLNELDFDTDYCIIFMGTNDFKYEIPLGTIDWNSPFNRNEFFGAAAYALKELTTNYPNTRFIWMTPFRRYFEGNIPASRNFDGQTLDDFCDMIIEVTKYFGVECIDMRRCGINEYNYQNFIENETHPKNRIASELIADHVFRKLI